MSYFDYIPDELLHEIASNSDAAYHALLAYPRFARMITPINRIDYMVLFGYNVKIRGSKQMWYRNGKLHRTDGPAILDIYTGNSEWYREGRLHRDDGPAIITHDFDINSGFIKPPWITPWGQKIWYRNGMIHRDDGPATIHNNGTEIWRQHGVIHRIGGPAKIYNCGKFEWYRKRNRGEQVQGWIDEINKEWFVEGKLHRDDGPAVIHGNGYRAWYQNGELQRDNDFRTTHRPPAGGSWIRG